MGCGDVELFDDDVSDVRQYEYKEHHVKKEKVELPPWLLDPKPKSEQETVGTLRKNNSSTFNIRKNNSGIIGKSSTSSVELINPNRSVWNRASRVEKQSVARRSSAETVHVDLFDKSENASVVWNPEDGENLNVSFHPIQTALDIEPEAFTIGEE